MSHEDLVRVADQHRTQAVALRPRGIGHHERPAHRLDRLFRHRRRPVPGQGRSEDAEILDGAAQPSGGVPDRVPRALVGCHGALVHASPVARGEALGRQACVVVGGGAQPERGNHSFLNELGVGAARNVRDDLAQDVVAEVRVLEGLQAVEVDARRLQRDPEVVAEQELTCEPAAVSGRLAFQARSVAEQVPDGDGVVGELGDAADHRIVQSDATFLDEHHDAEGREQL